MVFCMENREFCKSISADIAGWRAKMYDIIGHVETLPSLDRQYFAPDMNALRAMISEMDDSVRSLKTECPVDCSVLQAA